MISHSYIKDILSYVKISNNVQSYVSTTLSANLSAYIATKEWNPNVLFQNWQRSFSR